MYIRVMTFLADHQSSSSSIIHHRLQQQLRCSSRMQRIRKTAATTMLSSLRRMSPTLFQVILITFSLLSSPVFAGTTASATTTTSNSMVYEYNICNGLSNQLLYHAASIAIAIQTNKKVVLIPNHFIVNGVQLTNENVVPTYNNSVPLHYVLDTQHLVQSVESISNGKLHVLFVTYENDAESKLIPCAGMKQVVQADPNLIRSLLQKAFQPSLLFSTIINDIQSQLIVSNSKKDDNNMNHGICVHHRDGYDWHEHCKRWSNIKDGIYRGNCLSVPNETFIESLQYRGLQPQPKQQQQQRVLMQKHQFEGNNNNKITMKKLGKRNNNSNYKYIPEPIQQQEQWVYYCGDHEPPEELKALTKVYTRNDEPFQIIISKYSTSEVGINNDAIATKTNNNYLSTRQKFDNDSNNMDERKRIMSLLFSNDSRDIAALIDFFVCKSIPAFIGNSVSTFSALQIAIRDGSKSYWYNSQSIPLASMWEGYHIPIVYTYTELSKESGKFLLQASISSVRKHMPLNPIHILYDGTSDTEFRSWLYLMNVIVHDHDPGWRNSIELMRQNGNSGTSNLFLHPGNYFGTWQRIDIPLFMDSEYCLLLDSDTIVKKAFTLHDFGLNLTRSIALSAEGDHYDRRPWNAGVMLMNIPYLRKTHTKFINYILDHIDTARFNNHPAPSDQGAYLTFYNETVSFLDTRFNFKPYWYTDDDEYYDSFILHFHGAKPHDYLMYIMGERCDDAIQSLCADGYNIIFLCQSLLEFAKNVNHIDYCYSSFPDQYEKEQLCVTVFETLANNNVDGCYYFDTLLLGHTNLQKRRRPMKKNNKQRKPSSSFYNSLFRGIKNYKTRRLVRITVSWIIGSIVFIIVCVLLKRQLTLSTVSTMKRQQQQLKLKTTITRTISSAQKVIVSSLTRRTSTTATTVK